MCAHTDPQQYLDWMHALESVLINPQQLSLRDFELVALIGRGAFGQVLQVHVFLCALCAVCVVYVCV